MIDSCACGGFALGGVGRVFPSCPRGAAGGGARGGDWVGRPGCLKGTQGPRLGCRAGSEFQFLSFALPTSRVPLQQTGRETEKPGN